MDARISQALAPLAALTLAACASTDAALPPGTGLRAHDRTAPTGVATFAQPNLLVGDELAYRRGDRFELRYVVKQGAVEGFELIDSVEGRVMAVDDSLARLGERPSDAAELEVRFDPFDPSYSWPLWVGKRWTGEFTLRTPEGDIPVVAHYECDALESVQTPAGTFDALRIWRRDRVNAPGNFVERTTVEWFAPEVGYFVKRLEDGLLTVLVDSHRQ